MRNTNQEFLKKLTMKPTVYIETSIIGYLTTKPSNDSLTAAHQQITADWWQTIQPQVTCFISPFVVREISQGHPEAATRRLQIVSHLSVLHHNDKIEQLAHTYFAATGIPEKTRMDAFHLAMAVWHQMDYLLSWNCKHIVSARVRKIVQEINQQQNMLTPIICTPQELMEV